MKLREGEYFLIIWRKDFENLREFNVRESVNEYMNSSFGKIVGVGIFNRSFFSIILWRVDWRNF